MASKKHNKNPIEIRNEKRSIERAAKKHRRSRSARKPRQRDWEQYADDEFYEAGTERVMPTGEAERRQMVAAEAERATAPDQPAIPTETEVTAPNGRVVEVSSGLCRVKTDSDTLLCGVRGGLLETESAYTNVITVGDHVTVSPTEPGRGVVETIHPRETLIARPDPGGAPLLQMVAANIDQLLIVQAWRHPNIWYELVDRYLITAGLAGVRPIICVNKVDLAEDLAHVEAEIAPYSVHGYDVLLTSAADGTGIGTLRERLRGKTTAVAGLSGVGKSTLLSAVEPGFQLATGNVNEERGQGRHTTTQATMLPFGDGYVIDTPGIREFGLSGLTSRELERFYPEMTGLACKFGDCTHTHEPGCGVLEELQTGGISEIRYHSYQEIRKSLE